MREDLKPGLLFFNSDPVEHETPRDYPDWVVIEMITGKKCPDTIDILSLSKMSQTEMGNALGLNWNQSKKLSAALVLGERLVGRSMQRDSEVSSARNIYEIFSRRLNQAKKESFHIVSLDQKHHILDIHRISEGSLTMTLVHPREAFKPAIQDSAAGIIFCHNHPSGNPEPSVDDEKLTIRLIECGELLGIRVVDHVVVGRDGYVSLRERGFFRQYEESGSIAAESPAYGFRENPPDKTSKSMGLK